MAERGIDRKATYYYGARQPAGPVLRGGTARAWKSALPGFRYVPALSEPADDDGWDGEAGLITDVVKRHEADLADAHAYVCGPPPMVEAALPRAHHARRVARSASTTTSSPPPVIPRQ